MQEKSVLTDKLASGDNNMARIKRAIAKQDLVGLTDAIYEAKIKNQKGDGMQKLILQAEEAIVQLSAKIWKDYKLLIYTAKLQ